MLNRYLALLTFLFLISCSSKRNIIYLQDITKYENSEIEFEDYTVKADDILKIDVFSEIPESTLIFNNGNTSINSNINKESLAFNGFQVNSKGYINYPIFGKIKVIDLTLDQVRDLIFEKITNSQLLLNPSIDVKLINAHFSILGEVNKPGRYEYLKNNLNLLEAIGIAGDLTINGKRDDINIIREKNGKLKTFKIDITSSNFISNKNFQVISGDIIIVNPNSTRIKNAGIIGNSGTLLSLLSFILSSIIVISNR